jgi:hypothetical protein
LSKYYLPQRNLYLSAGVVALLVVGLTVALWLFLRCSALREPKTVDTSAVMRDSPGDIDRQDEDYAVYSAVVTTIYAEGRLNQLVIGIETGCTGTVDPKIHEMQDQMKTYAFSKLTELQEETIFDFNSHENDCRLLTHPLKLPIKYVLVTKKEIEAFFDDKQQGQGWGYFYSRYQGSSGIIGLSNIGYNHLMNQAVVSTSKSCGGKCGAENYVVLDKKNGVWIVKAKIMTWVS